MNDTKRIQAAMRYKGYTLKTLSKPMGITPTTLFNKIHNKSEFTASEILFLCDKLGIRDKNEYFFVHNVN